jgi:hypothetical protein
MRRNFVRGHLCRQERKGDFISALREFIGLMREDIAAS